LSHSLETMASLVVAPTWFKTKAPRS
jgi:hypothetical protein